MDVLDAVDSVVTGALIAGGGFLAWITGMFIYVVRKNAKEMSPPDPRKVLEMRYVKGEIDEAEYRRRLSVITYGPPLPSDLPVPPEDLTPGLPAPRAEEG